MSQTMAEYVAENAAARARNQTTRDNLKTFLTARFGELPPKVQAVIEKADLETVNAWIPLAATAETLDEVGILSGRRN